VRLARIDSARFGEQMDRFALPALFGLFRVPEWNNAGVIVADTSLGHMIVDAMLGGGHAGMAQAPTELRAFTSIETSLVARMMQLALSDLAEAFAPIAAVAMEFERVESNPRLASIARPGIGTVVCTFAIETEGCVGKLAVLLPHTTLEPVRDKLVQRFIGESLGTDRLWEAHFEGEIRRTALELQAVVAERTMSLREVQSLQAGQLLRLDRNGNEPVALQAEGIPLAAGHLGQRNGRIAVRLLNAIGA
jgi:flagellar motor switch protein FliM